MQQNLPGVFHAYFLAEFRLSNSHPRRMGAAERNPQTPDFGLAILDFGRFTRVFPRTPARHPVGSISFHPRYDSPKHRPVAWV